MKTNNQPEYRKHYTTQLLRNDITKTKYRKAHSKTSKTYLIKNFLKWD